MRIAVLVFGRLNKCVEHYTNIMDSIGREHKIDFFVSSDNSSEELLQDFIRLYNPISYINDKIEHTINLSKYKNCDVTNIDNMIRHFINKYRVFSLLENFMEMNTDIQYNIIMSLRIDLLFKSKFDFTSISNEIPSSSTPEFRLQNKIFIPYKYNWEGVNDQLA